MRWSSRHSMPGEDVYLALDLSNVIDLTALLMGEAGEQDAGESLLYKPEDRLKEHGNRDFGSASDRYTQWVKAGTFIGVAGTVDLHDDDCAADH